MLKDAIIHFQLQLYNIFQNDETLDNLIHTYMITITALPQLCLVI
jgi:hypothetical protein